MNRLQIIQAISYHRETRKAIQTKLQSEGISPELLSKYTQEIQEVKREIHQLLTKLGKIAIEENFTKSKKHYRRSQLVGLIECSEVIPKRYEGEQNGSAESPAKQ